MASTAYTYATKQRRCVRRACVRPMQRAPALSHSRRSDCTVVNYTTAAGKRPPVPPKHGDVAPDGARRSRGWGGCCSWGWLSAPAFGLGAENYVLPPLQARVAQPPERGASVALRRCPPHSATWSAKVRRQAPPAPLSGRLENWSGHTWADSTVCVPRGGRLNSARRLSGAQLPRTAPSSARPLFRTY